MTITDEPHTSGSELFHEEYDKDESILVKAVVASNSTSVESNKGESKHADDEKSQELQEWQKESMDSNISESENEYLKKTQISSKVSDDNLAKQDDDADATNQVMTKPEEYKSTSSLNHCSRLTVKSTKDPEEEGKNPLEMQNEPQDKALESESHSENLHNLAIFNDSCETGFRKESFLSCSQPVTSSRMPSSSYLPEKPAKRFRPPLRKIDFGLNKDKKHESEIKVCDLRPSLALDSTKVLSTETEIIHAHNEVLNTTFIEEVATKCLDKQQQDLNGGIKCVMVDEQVRNEYHTSAISSSNAKNSDLNQRERSKLSGSPYRKFKSLNLSPGSQQHPNLITNKTIIDKSLMEDDNDHGVDQSKEEDIDDKIIVAQRSHIEQNLVLTEKTQEAASAGNEAKEKITNEDSCVDKREIERSPTGTQGFVADPSNSASYSRVGNIDSSNENNEGKYKIFCDSPKVVSKMFSTEANSMFAMQCGSTTKTDNMHQLSFSPLLGHTVTVADGSINHRSFTADTESSKVVPTEVGQESDFQSSQNEKSDESSLFTIGNSSIQNGPIQKAMPHTLLNDTPIPSALPCSNPHENNLTNAKSPVIKKIESSTYDGMQSKKEGNTDVTSGKILIREEHYRPTNPQENENAASAMTNSINGNQTKQIGECYKIQDETLTSPRDASNKCTLKSQTAHSCNKELAQPRETLESNYENSADSFVDDVLSFSNIFGTISDNHKSDINRQTLAQIHKADKTKTTDKAYSQNENSEKNKNISVDETFRQEKESIENNLASCVDNALVQNSVEDTLFGSLTTNGRVGNTLAGNEASLTAITQAYASVTGGVPQPQEDIQSSMTDLDFCDLDTHFLLENGDMCAEIENKDFDQFENEIQKNQATAIDQIQTKRAEGASVVKSILGDLMSMNRQLMKMKKEMDIVSRNLGKIFKQGDTSKVKVCINDARYT